VDETVQGTYTINADCTGSATVYVYHGSVLARVSHINLVWDAHQNEARAIFLNPGTNISIEARRDGRRRLTPARLRQELRFCRNPANCEPGGAPRAHDAC
jgi:hypothetical protein